MEDQANGPAVIDTLKHEIGGIIPLNPEGGKYARASAREAKVEAENVYLPQPTAANGRSISDREWVYDFIEQLADFPRGDHDDDVDAFTQVIVRLETPPYVV